MIIRCPKCNFTKTVDDQSIPASAQMATCPKCRYRFNFRERAVEDNPGSQSESTLQNSASEEAVTPRTAAKRYEGIAHIEKNDASVQPDRSDSASDEKKDLWDSIEALGDQWEKKDQPENQRVGSQENQFAGDKTGNEEPSAYRTSGANKFQKAHSASEPNAIPWESARGTELLPAFFTTISRAILSAPRFFTSVRSHQSPLRAVVFYILVNFLPVFINLVYLLNFRRAVLEPLFDRLQMTAAAFFVGVAIVSPLQSLVALLFFAIVTNTVLHVLGVNGVNFNKTLRVMAYTGAPVILSFIPLIGPPAALFLGIMVSAQALRYSYALSWRNVVMALLPGYLLVLVVSIPMLRIAFSALS